MKVRGFGSSMRQGTWHNVLTVGWKEYFVSSDTYLGWESDLARDVCPFFRAVDQPVPVQVTRCRSCLFTLMAKYDPVAQPTNYTHMDFCVGAKFLQYVAYEVQVRKCPSRRVTSVIGPTCDTRILRRIKSVLLCWTQDTLAAFKEALLLKGSVQPIGYVITQNVTLVFKWNLVWLSISTTIAQNNFWYHKFWIHILPTRCRTF